MGWETRNGRQYYYQKVREGDKVISRYIGSGETAHLIADFERLTTNSLQAMAVLQKTEAEEQKQQEIELDAHCSAVEAMFRQAMTAAGYHQHNRGEWRKQRGHK